MIVKLLTEHHLKFLKVKGGFRGSSESTRQNTTVLEITSWLKFDLSGNMAAG